MSSSTPINLLLESLPAEVRSSVLAQCDHVDMPFRAPLFGPIDHPRYVHFMTSGIASTVNTTESGGAVEVGITGSEGIAEKYQLLGPQLGDTRCFMQIEGQAYRMSFKRFQAEFLKTPSLLHAVHRYIQHDAMVLSQLSACNRIHEVEERLARWLLMVYDRVQTSEIKLTQEFLGEMLGTRRSSVNIAIGRLQQAGFITNTRGKVMVKDREALQQVACECYPVISKMFHSLYR